MRARIAVEGETAAMAAKQTRDADIRELGRILETMDPHLDFKETSTFRQIEHFIPTSPKKLAIAYWFASWQNSSTRVIRR